MQLFKISPSAPKVYSEPLRIRSYHTDVNCRLTIPKLCSFFQEVAGNHTVACGVGWDVIQEHHMFWVLSRMRIEIERLPVWQEKIMIRTWSNGLSGIMAIRHFQVLDEAGREIIKAISSWLMVDTRSRRLVRADEYMHDFPLCHDRLFDENPDKLQPLLHPVFFGASPVRYTETDMNMHMNNVCYIERIINTFEFAFLKDNQIAGFEINFLKEAVPGDLLDVSTEKTGERQWLGNGVSPDRKTEYVRTLMTWRSNNGR